MRLLERGTKFAFYHSNHSCSDLFYLANQVVSFLSCPPQAIMKIVANSLQI
jgi:hypothetical protein